MIQKKKSRSIVHIDYAMIRPLPSDNVSELKTSGLAPQKKQGESERALELGARLRGARPTSGGVLLVSKKAHGEFVLSPVF